MRRLAIILLLLNYISYGQITDNPSVVDPNAIKLDDKILEKFTRVWHLTSTVETFHGTDYLTDRGYLVHFSPDFDIEIRNCSDCGVQLTGNFSFIDEYRIKIESNRKKHMLNGTWVIHQLTDTTLNLVKIFTSTGDWKRKHRFNNKTTDLIASNNSDNCSNCTIMSNGKWCWGVNYLGAKEHWTILMDQLTFHDNSNRSTKIEKEINWLLKNAPCLNRSMYVRAREFYGLILTNLNNKQKKEVEKKIKEIMGQQSEYFETKK